MKKLLEYYKSRNRHFTIGLTIHLIGGLILALRSNTILPIPLMGAAFFCWFMYDYTKAKEKEKQDQD